MAQNGNTLLNYILKLDVRTPTADANTDYLRAAVAVVKPKASGATGTITKVTSASAAAELTDNTDIAELFNAGMNSVLVLPVNDLDLADVLAAATEKFYTLLISSDFSKTEIDALDTGDFDGVVGACFTAEADAKAFAAQEKHSGWYTSQTTKGANMFYAFGALLSASSWDNQQYIPAPKDDGVTDLADAETMFADRVSFVLTDPDQYGSRVAFFVAGRQAIVAPYVTQELMLNLQGAALQYLNLNRPQYTVTQAKLLEDYLQSDAAARYVDTKLLDYVTVTITLTERNYEGDVDVSIPEPTAFWRLLGTLTQEAQNA